jgi:hypothetical protein
MASSFIGQSGLPIGLRNNNPGNLRLSNDVWKGQIGSESGFVTFSDLAWGTRAMATVVANDINKGLNTLTQYITSYAPPSENDTAAYIARMSSLTGIPPDQPFIRSLDTIKLIIKAQMQIELGPDFAAMVPDADIDQGLALMNSQILSDFTQVQQAVQTAGTPKTLFVLGWAFVIITLLRRK